MSTKDHTSETTPPPIRYRTVRAGRLTKTSRHRSTWAIQVYEDNSAVGPITFGTVSHEHNHLASLALLTHAHRVIAADARQQATLAEYRRLQMPEPTWRLVLPIPDTMIVEVDRWDTDQPGDQVLAPALKLLMRTVTRPGALTVGNARHAPQGRPYNITVQDPDALWLEIR